MKIIVRTPVSQKRVEISSVSELDSAIKNKFKIERYDLFSDVERKTPLDLASLSDGLVIYMNYDIQEPKIYKNENTCTHDPQAICPNCATLDPYERLQRKDTKVDVKYLSHESYREMLKNTGKAEPEYDYRRKKCSDHSENAQCSRCMEKAITLVPQVYRPIDYVEFDNKICVEEFIQKWRNSSRQQVGLLVGKTCSHKPLPKAKKVVVSGIWEVTQERYPDGVALQGLPSKFICDELRIVGVIYTDIFKRDSELYSYKVDRNYIISAVELNFIHEIQAQIGEEEFVGICVRPNAEREIILECFMLSEQFKALMNVYALELTTEPAYFYTKRPIRYMIRNEYDKVVPKDESSLIPVDYFIVKCECGYLDTPLFRNTEVIAKPTFYRLANYFHGDFSFEKFHNFSVLMAISKHSGDAGKMMSAVLSDDRAAFEEILRSASFQKVLQSIQGACEGTWNCLACTYINSTHSVNCEMCNTQRDGES